MGTITKRGKSYRALVRIAGHPALSKTFPTAKEASAWVRNTETELFDRELTNPRIKIVDLIDLYVREVAPKRRMAESHLDHDIPSIRTCFKDMRMEDLTGKGLRDWVVQGKGSSTPKLRYWHIARLTGVLKQVQEHYDINVPWKDIKAAKGTLVKLGYIQPSNERDRRVSDTEIAAIKTRLGGKRIVPMADIIDFCVASAMRIGEVCRITWADLNEDRRTVVVRDRKHPTRKFGNHQTVPLLGKSFEVVMRQPRTSDRIFPHRPGYVSRVFHDCVTAAGLEDLVLHDLRHEGISRLFELGFQIPEVSLVSGHRDWKALRRYTNLRPESLVEKDLRLRSLVTSNSPAQAVACA